MIAFIKGTLVEVEEGAAVVENGGIGYRVYVTGRDLDVLRPGAQVQLYTYFQVREDAMQLFGFLSRDDLRVFKLLLGVNGIGPKAALGILTGLSANDLRFAVLANDAGTICRAPGIGKKTAQKILLELKDKFDLNETFEQKLEQTASGLRAETDSEDEAVQALSALGYPAADALKAVRAVSGAEGMSTEEILKAALKQMSFL